MGSLRKERVADRHLAHLPARRLVAADPHLEAAERHGIGRARLALVLVVGDVVGVVVQPVGALVGLGVAILVDPIEL